MAKTRMNRNQKSVFTLFIIFFGSTLMGHGSVLNTEAIALWVILAAWFFGVRDKTPPQPPLTRLRNAVRSSDTVALRDVIAANPALLRYQDDQGATPLHWAAKAQDLSVVAALVDLGADVTIKNALAPRLATSPFPSENSAWALTRTSATRSFSVSMPPSHSHRHNFPSFR